MSNGRSSNSRPNVVREITSKIRGLNELNELKPKKYADEGGYADQIADYFSGRGGDDRVLNSNQLRKFFGAIRDIESKEGNWEEIESQFYLLKPKLAVSVGRKLIPRDFYNLMMACMSKIDVEDDENKEDNENKIKNFKTLVNFLEAIVAYRKFHDLR